MFGETTGGTPEPWTIRETDLTRKAVRHGQLEDEREIWSQIHSEGVP